MKLLKIGVALIGAFVIGLGVYVLLYRQISFTEKQQIINISALQPIEWRFPQIFPALLIIAGVLVIVFELIDHHNS